MSEPSEDGAARLPVDLSNLIAKQLVASTDFEPVFNSFRRSLVRILADSGLAESTEKIAATTVATFQLRLLEQLRPTLQQFSQIVSAPPLDQRSREALVALLQAAAEQRLVNDAIADEMDGLSDLANDVAFVAEANEALRGPLHEQPDLELAIEELAEEVSRTSALPRELARKIVLVVVYLLTTGAMVGISLVPGLGALPSAMGLTAPGAAKAAGRRFDRILPPSKPDDGDPNATGLDEDA